MKNHSTSIGNNFVHNFFRISVATIGLLLAGQIFGQSKNSSPLDIKLKAQTVEVAADGKELLKDNASTAPGGVVLYTATYHSNSLKPLGNVQPILPIPEGMEYIPDTASPAPASASIDGKTFEPVPLTRTRKLPSGDEVAYRVPISSYRALRWDAGTLSPGASFVVTARARIANR
ncbi:hypothetical protein [Oleiharenicola lentus]|uniref:hypothetical protein n=1 Tax=Oleiharenicola lentus TaxID=2508720 RepID=UPI003F66D145